MTHTVMVSVPLSDLELFIQNVKQKIEMFGVGDGPEYWVCSECGKRGKMLHKITHKKSCLYVAVSIAEGRLRKVL